MRLIKFALVLIITAALVSPLVPLETRVTAAPPPPDPLQALNDLTGGQLEVAYHPETGLASSVSATLDAPIEQKLTDAELQSEDGPAKAFLRTYGSLFGVTDPDSELTIMKSGTETDSHTFVRYQQVYQGIPVMGGELIVQSLPNGSVLSANGEFLPDIAVDTAPSFTAADAQSSAIARVAKGTGLAEDNLVASEPELWIYNPEIMGGAGIPRTSLAWRTEVTALDLQPIRELVLVDAQSGMMLLSFNQVDTALDLATYDANNTNDLRDQFICDESDLNCSSGDTHAKAAHLYAADTYSYYNSLFGRDSIDDAGMQLISVVHYSSDYDNAFWDGTEMVYGDYYGYPLADDVVAHELTHGVTEHESKLFYYFQSGAINESMSDIFAELMDQQNGHGTDTVAVKWQMGEDISGLGAIRSMSDPTVYGDPDKTSSTNYYCGESDGGGVHYNSGIGNKAAYLMTDGDSFNGQTITGIGGTKTAQIFYRVNSRLLTSAADYLDLYSAVNTACTTLVGSYGITSANCTEVNKALLAVEMNVQPSSCTTPVAATCSAGTIPQYTFYDNLENTSTGNWTFITNQGSSYWAYPQNPNYLTPYGWDMTYATSGVTNIYGYDYSDVADYSVAMAKNVTLPASVVSYLGFNHAFSFDHNYTYAWDGGVIEYSTNSGSTWNDAGSLIDSGQGYNSVIQSGYSNPLTGRTGFGLLSYGYVSSRLDLTPLMGQNVRFRFRIGTDSSVDDYGWYIDDVKIYSCYTPAGLDNNTYLPLTSSGW